MFETFAVSLAAHNDAIAERAVTLGAKAHGTARHVAKTSNLLEGLRASRGVGEKRGDTDTVDLLTGIVSELEKHAWFLRASLE